jgi:hypothetical protein
MQHLTEAVLTQISESAAAATAAAEEAVTDPIWYFIPPGRCRRELGPFSVRQLYEYLSRWGLGLWMGRVQ